MIGTPEDLEFARFVEGRSPAASETVIWKPETLEFAMTTFVTNDAPPHGLVTSARCIVVREGTVLVVTDRDGVRHVLPGGRRERGESSAETAQREVREETGLHVAGLRQVGVMLYEHLTPWPKDYPYPYPYFMQVVFVATSRVYADVVCDDEWAASAGFMEVVAAREAIPDGPTVVARRGASNDAPLTRKALRTECSSIGPGELG